MKNDPRLVQGLIVDANKVYVEQGPAMFGQLRKVTKQKPGALIESRNIAALLEQQKVDPKRDVGLRLLATYCDSVERGIAVQGELQEWVLQGLRDIAYTDALAKEAFGLKRRVGNPSNTRTKSLLQIVCCYEYYKRVKQKEIEAIKAAADVLNMSTDAIRKAIQKVSVPKGIKLGLLAELGHHDYSDFMGQN